MSLRLRIAGAAGAAVAVAVVLAAVIVYLAIRSELRSEIESGLRGIARSAAYDRPPNGGGGGGNGPPNGVQEPPKRPFGGAPGYVQRITPQGVVSAPERRVGRPAGDRPGTPDRPHRPG